MRDNDFHFHFLDNAYDSSHKITLKSWELYITSPDWLDNKKATINLKNRE